MTERNCFDRQIVLLGEARKWSTPQTKRGRTIINPESVFWNERPYFHEQMLVSCWVRLVELEWSGGIRGRDIQQTGIVLEWITSLSGEQVVEKSQNRASYPKLLIKRNREKLMAQFLLISQPSFYQQMDWREELISTIRSDVAILTPLFKLSLKEAEKQVKKEVARTVRY